MKTYNCLNCDKPNIFSKNKINKFCSNACQGKYKWKNITIPRIENGKCTNNSVNILKKYLIEKFDEKCFECGNPPIWNNKPLTLQLDHIDGDSDNNKVSN